MPNYNIEVSHEQAQIILAALDFYSRIGSGQFSELTQMIRIGCVGECDENGKQKWPSLPNGSYAGYELTVKQLRDAAFPSLVELGSAGAHSIHSPKVNASFRNAYDMQQVIRHAIAWDMHPAGGATVSFGTPLKCGELEMVKVSRIKDV
jgi:hypothetical protein